ncbi:ER membrane protein complex subunit 8/9 [Marchantia polymorpha subsp. ruderalis]|uniref:MPN domain-containing protein n=2 Tax=Marchantia polymorpha TaxID=3197 RepID=A0AAF6AT66_MARPO|nr:hypothetical protein MARPO_0118s0025 [Marchantia polymorpha]BBM99636.1 hypothetical protein Mp_1g22620 [Marchantia polymorpha subsp. ruderalis]|eukprot:PTQ30889.1 hypothetical protein MARPO_0118s0025 [Marchantia polymorpha]
MVGDNKYEISQRAYIKIVLHALKHQCNSVNGVLVGKVTGAGNEASEEGNSKIEIVDAVPLFHAQLGVLPMLELALSQVEEHLIADKESLVIAGYYHANERFDDYELSPLARKIGDHIARYCPQAGVLLLDNRLLSSLGKGGNKKPVVQLYTRDSVRGWRLGVDLSLKEPTANSILSDYISEKREQLLFDFDDHLYDISKDWLNPDLYN